MKIFNSSYIDALTTEALNNPRKRQHRNLHESYKDSCQRLFNAIEPGSYIRPHRHVTYPGDELLIAVRGSMVLVIFDDWGFVSKVIFISANKSDKGLAIGVEIPAKTWHTVIALEAGSVLFEVKAGPFDPIYSKDLAPWAPEENSVEVTNYFNMLISEINKLQTECIDNLKC